MYVKAITGRIRDRQTAVSETCRICRICRSGERVRQRRVTLNRIIGSCKTETAETAQAFLRDANFSADPREAIAAVGTSRKIRWENGEFRAKGWRVPGTSSIELRSKAIPILIERLPAVRGDDARRGAERPSFPPRPRGKKKRKEERRREGKRKKKTSAGLPKNPE